MRTVFNYKLVFAYLFMLLVSPLIASEGQAGKSEKIVLATAEWPPFIIEKLPGYGFHPEITRQALTRMGYEFELAFLPWMRAIAEVKKGNYHGIFNNWKTPENKDLYYFQNVAYVTGEGQFLAHVDSDLVMNELKDLEGLSVGMVRGYPISRELTVMIDEKKIDAVYIKDLHQMIDVVENKRVDIGVENLLVASYTLNETENRKPNLKMVGRDLVDGSLVVGWSKALPNSEMLRDKYDAALTEMLEDGTIVEIIKEFGIDPHSVMPESAKKVAARHLN